MCGTFSYHYLIELSHALNLPASLLELLEGVIRLSGLPCSLKGVGDLSSREALNNTERREIKGISPTSPQSSS